MDICVQIVFLLIAEICMDASERCRDGVQLNRAAREQSVKHFEQSSGLDIVLHKNLYF